MGYNLCIIKPNQSAISETFIQEHIDRLAGNKKVLYGGAFPIYDDQGNYIIKSKLGLLNYLIQKKLLKRQDIKVRTNALVRYLKLNNIDLVFTEYGMVGGMVTKACQIADVPLVIQFHGADVHHRPTVAKYFNFYKKAFQYAGAFIAVSNDMVNALITLGAPAEKIFLNPCGVDTSKFVAVDIINSKNDFFSGRAFR